MVPQAREHGADNAVEIGLTANASGGNSSTYVFDWSVTGASNMDEHSSTYGLPHLLCR